MIWLISIGVIVMKDDRMRMRIIAGNIKSIKLAVDEKVLEGVGPIPSNTKVLLPLFLERNPHIRDILEKEKYAFYENDSCNTTFAIKFDDAILNMYNDRESFIKAISLMIYNIGYFFSEVFSGGVFQYYYNSTGNSAPQCSASLRILAGLMDDKLSIRYFNLLASFIDELNVTINFAPRLKRMDKLIDETYYVFNSIGEPINEIEKMICSENMVRFILYVAHTNYLASMFTGKQNFDYIL